jgi:hypothetical protein
MLADDLLAALARATRKARERPAPRRPGYALRADLVALPLINEDDQIVDALLGQEVAV